MDFIPYNIDGKACFKVTGVTKGTYVNHTKDGRNFKLNTAWRKGKNVLERTIRKVGWCQGSWECSNQLCLFRAASQGTPNKTNFARRTLSNGTTVQVCSTCKQPGQVKYCGARKMVEFVPSEGTVYICHIGRHSCTARKMNRSYLQDKTEVITASNPVQKRGPVQIQREEVAKKLAQGDLKGAMEEAQLWQDTQETRRLQRNLGGNTTTGMDAIAELKSKYDLSDPYLIFAAEDGRLGRDQETYVFKSSKFYCDISIQLDCDSDSPFKDSYLFIDAMHSRVAGHKSIALWVTQY